MSGHHIKRLVFLGLSLGLIGGCVKTPVPSTWPLAASAKDGVIETYGSWIRLGEISGELIAIELPKIWVLTDQGRIVVVSAAEVAQADLIVYRNSADTIGTLSVLGTLSTASHGFGAALSAPIWIIAGICASSFESGNGWLKFPGTDWNEFKKFARYPQGLPKDLDLSLLKPKR
jgi:hypothetical protein